MDVISHDTLLFNVHDFVLLLSAVFSLILAVTFFLFTYRNLNQTNIFLGAIFFFSMAQSINTLIIWSEPLRLLILSSEPNLFFWGGLGFWLQGPLLFWLVSSLIEPDFKLNHFSSLHLIPAILAGTLIAINYHLLSEDIQVNKMSYLLFLRSGLMDHITTTRYLSIIAYGGVCLGALSYKQKSLAEQELREPHLYLWLKVGVCCSIIMGAWPLLVHLTSNRIALNTSNIMGLATNYLSLFFSLTFMFTMLKYCSVTHNTKTNKVKNTPSIIEPSSIIEESPKINTELIKFIENHMAYEKPFLKHNINLEILATRLSIPERTLSRAINQHFKKNFVEFINSYRIVEAKKGLITDQSNQKSMLTIMDEAGFNSKSTFNSIFKQQVGMTPSQFRKKTQQGSNTLDIEE